MAAWADIIIQKRRKKDLAEAMAMGVGTKEGTAVSKNRPC